MLEFYQGYYATDYRAGRLEYLTSYVVISLVGAVLGFGAQFLASMIWGINLFTVQNINPAMLTNFTLSDVTLTFMVLISFIVANLIVVLWPLTSMTIRRLHDHNLSGWYFLVLLMAPVVIGFGLGVYTRSMAYGAAEAKQLSQHVSIGLMVLYVFVLFLKRGTRGTNRFGADTSEVKAYIRQRKYERKLKG